MKAIYLFLGTLWLCFFAADAGAQSQDEAVFKTIVSRYYKTEKPVVKNRSQLLYLYCERAPNNEELIEAIQLEPSLPQTLKTAVKQSIGKPVNGNWNAALEALPEADPSKLKQKIAGCYGLEQYQTLSKRLNLNNQRLMILNQPIYDIEQKYALVKVAFYRNIEHNSASVLFLERTEHGWIIKKYLNPWST